MVNNLHARKMIELVSIPAGHDWKDAHFLFQNVEARLDVVGRVPGVKLVEVDQVGPVAVDDRRQGLTTLEGRGHVGDHNLVVRLHLLD